MFLYKFTGYISTTTYKSKIEDCLHGLLIPNLAPTKELKSYQPNTRQWDQVTSEPVPLSNVWKGNQRTGCEYEPAEKGNWRRQIATGLTSDQRLGGIVHLTQKASDYKDDENVFGFDQL
ncbi:hypothetical protein STEG23_001913 [Scotinomys teguina]